MGESKPVVVGNSCGGCDNKWGGFLTAHCPSCHLTFGSVRNFDLHRDKGKCLNPATTQLVGGTKANPGPPMTLGKRGYWGFPVPEGLTEDD